MRNASLLRGLGFILLVVGAIVGGIYGSEYFRFAYGSSDERLQILWEQDNEKLKASGMLPEAWNDIKEIQLIPATDNAKAWLKNIQVPIRLKSDGQHKMEILVISWEEAKASGVILQYNLVDIKTNNLIWELGRTFVLSGEPDVLSETPRTNLIDTEAAPPASHSQTESEKAAK